MLQLVQLGAPLDAVDMTYRDSALQWACLEGHERVAEALLDGKYEGRGAKIDCAVGALTLLMRACERRHEGIVRLLLERGARQEPQGERVYTALHFAVSRNMPGIVAILCGAAGAAAAFALRDVSGRTPLGLSIHRNHAACEAVLRAAMA